GQNSSVAFGADDQEVRQCDVGLDRVDSAVPCDLWIKSRFAQFSHAAPETDELVDVGRQRAGEVGCMALGHLVLIQVPIKLVMTVIPPRSVEILKRRMSDREHEPAA